MRLPADAVLIVIDVQEAISHIDGVWHGIVERHEQLRHDRQRPILDPAEVYLPPAELEQTLTAWPTVALRLLAARSMHGLRGIRSSQARSSNRMPGWWRTAPVLRTTSDIIWRRRAWPKSVVMRCKSSSASLMKPGYG